MAEIQFEFEGQTVRVMEDGVPSVDFCRVGWSPHLVTGLIRQLLVQHFQDPGRIEHPQLKKYLWDDSESSSILIETVYRWRPELAGKRPALLVRREQYQSQRLSIANMLHGGVSRTGADRHALLWTGGHTVIAISSDGLQCELLASEVHRLFAESQQEILRRTGLKRLMVAGLSPVAQLREYAENYAVAVSLECAMEELWQSGPVRPRLARVDMRVNSEGDR